MQLSIPPFRGFYKPPGIPRINPSHPAAAFLKPGTFSGVWLCSDGLFFDITGNYPTEQATTNGHISSMGGSVGEYAYFNGSSNIIMGGSQTPSGNYSVICLCKTDSVTNVQNVISTSNLGGATGGLELDLTNRFVSPQTSIVLDDQGGSAVTVFLNGVAQTASIPVPGPVGSPTISGQWYCVGGTYVGGTAGICPLVFGGLANGGGFFLTGGISITMLLKGVVPPAVMKALTLDPFGILIFPEDDVASLLKGTGGGGSPKAIAEAISSTSLCALTLGRSRALSETATSVSAVTSTIHKTGALNETISSTSLCSLALKRSRPINESIAATSTITATPHKTGVLNETLASTSSLALALGRSHPITEAIAATSSFTLSLARSRSLIETIAATSAVTAAPHKVGVLSQTIASTSAYSATLRRSRPIGEAISATSLVTIGISKPGAGQTTSITSTSLITFTIHKHGALSESVAATSLLAITPHRSRSISEAIAATSIFICVNGELGPLAVAATFASTSLCSMTLNRTRPTSTGSTIRRVTAPDDPRLVTAPPNSRIVTIR